MNGREGQSTLEYLLVLGAFVAMLAAIGLIWHAARDGILVDLSIKSASHGAGQGMVGLLKDVMSF